MIGGIALKNTPQRNMELEATYSKVFAGPPRRFKGQTLSSISLAPPRFAVSHSQVGHS